MGPQSIARRTFGVRVATTKAAPSCTKQARKDMAPRSKTNHLILSLPADQHTRRRHLMPQGLFDLFNQLFSLLRHRRSQCSGRIAKTRQTIEIPVSTHLRYRQLRAGQTRTQQRHPQETVDLAKLEAGRRRAHNSYMLRHQARVPMNLSASKAPL
jgi:hypothetical protein